MMSVLTDPSALSRCGIFLQSKSCGKNNKENLERVEFIEIFICKGLREAKGEERGGYLRARHRTNTTKREAKFKNSRIAP
jgi:hypothetical protein